MIELICGTYGRGDAALSLATSIRQEEGFRLTIVDQNPDPRLFERVDAIGDPKVRVLTSRRGLSRARNAALRTLDADVDIVGFPDDDCLLDGDVLRHVERIVKDGFDFVVLRQSWDGTPTGPRYPRRSGVVTRRNLWRCVNSNGLFVSRRALEGVGGFDERLGVGADSPWQAGEDLWLVSQLLQRGSRGWFARYPMSIHPDLRDVLDYHERLARERRYGLGYGAALAQEPRTRVAYHILRPVIGSIVALPRGNFDIVRLGLAIGFSRYRGYRSFRSAQRKGSGDGS